MDLLSSSSSALSHVLNNKQIRGISTEEALMWHNSWIITPAPAPKKDIKIVCTVLKLLAKH